MGEVVTEIQAERSNGGRTGRINAASLGNNSGSGSVSSPVPESHQLIVMVFNAGKKEKERGSGSGWIRNAPIQFNSIKKGAS